MVAIKYYYCKGLYERINNACFSKLNRVCKYSKSKKNKK